MKTITTANGRKKIKLSKNEWKSIGEKAGWMKSSQKKENTSKLNRTAQNQQQEAGKILRKMDEAWQTFTQMYDEINNMYQGNSDMSNMTTIPSMIDKTMTSLEVVKQTAPRIAELSQANQQQANQQTNQQQQQPQIGQGFSPESMQHLFDNP